MTALLEAVEVGCQTPRIMAVPDTAVTSRGGEAVEFARQCGIDLDPWERLALDHMLGLRADGKWSASRFGLVMPRQNGKSLVLLIRELYGAVRLGEELIMHTAHRFKTSIGAYRAMRHLWERSEFLQEHIRSMPKSHGEESADFYNGAQIQFLTRTDSGGRGLTGQVIVFDEAQELADTQASALLYTVSAQSVQGNPQVLYAGSAGTYKSTALGRLRRSAIVGGNPSLAFLEWSIDDESFYAADPNEQDDLAQDPGMWAQANPALGVRISAEHILAEYHEGDLFEFAKERLGVGAWPEDDARGWTIPKDAWVRCGDRHSGPVGPGPAIAVDIGDDACWVVGVGARDDGMPYGVLLKSFQDVGSVPGYIAELVKHRQACAVLLDPGSLAGSLVQDLRRVDVEPVPVNTIEYGQACVGLKDAVVEGRFRHGDQPELTRAVGAAKPRPTRDAWVWDRRRSDVAPLVALTLARWGCVKFGLGPVNIDLEFG